MGRIDQTNEKLTQAELQIWENAIAKARMLYENVIETKDVHFLRCATIDNRIFMYLDRETQKVVFKEKDWAEVLVRQYAEGFVLTPKKYDKNSDYAEYEGLLDVRFNLIHSMPYRTLQVYGNLAVMESVKGCHISLLTKRKVICSFQKNKSIDTTILYHEITTPDIKNSGHPYGIFYLVKFAKGSNIIYVADSKTGKHSKVVYAGNLTARFIEHRPGVLRIYQVEEDAGLKASRAKGIKLNNQAKNSARTFDLDLLKFLETEGKELE